MCGIVYAHNFKGEPVNNLVLDTFDAQRHRGTQGFGLFDGQEKHMVKASKENGILKWLVKYDSNLLLFHHRLPTSSLNTKRNAHPFTTGDFFGKNQYILVHNGHISNADKLKETHAKLGIEYQTVNQDGSFNDSEALLWDIALYLQGKQEELKMYGQAAFVCIKLYEGIPQYMYFGSNGNPLKLLREKGGILLSSEGQGEMIATDTIYAWNYDKHRLTKKALKIPRWSSEWNYSSYSKPDTSASASAPRWNTGSQWPTHQIPAYLDTARDWQRRIWGSELENEQFNEVEEQEDLELELYNAIKVDEAECEELALKYLARYKGNFEAAYGELEIDYMQIAEDCMSTEDYSEMRLFEEAMTYLAHDPEWLNDDSISSMWTESQALIKNVGRLMLASNGQLAIV